MKNTVKTLLVTSSLGFVLGGQAQANPNICSLTHVNNVPGTCVMAHDLDSGQFANFLVAAHKKAFGLTVLNSGASSHELRVELPSCATNVTLNGAPVYEVDTSLYPGIGFAFIKADVSACKGPSYVNVSQAGEYFGFESSDN